MTGINEVYYTYDQMHCAAREMTYKIKGDLQSFKTEFYPELIVGVARGGLYLALVISQIFKVPVISVNYSSKVGKGNDKHHRDDTKVVNSYINDSGLKNILLVDDIVDAGATLSELVNIINKTSTVDMKTAAFFYKETSIIKPDYYWKKIPGDSGWIVMPWEL